MIKYIVLLRGINVSGKNKLPMQELRELLKNSGFENVQTYIQSGNIILESKKSKVLIAQEIKQAIAQKFGYDVPVIIRTVDEWKKITDMVTYPLNEEKSLYFTFLDSVPEKTEITINKLDSDEYTIINDVVYLYCLGGYGNTKLSNNIFEKKLDVKASTRNYRTTMKLLELATKE